MTTRLSRLIKAVLVLIAVAVATLWVSDRILTLESDLYPLMAEPLPDASFVPQEGQAEEETATVAVVRLDEVMPLHPRWSELQGMEEELSRLQNNQRLPENGFSAGSLDKQALLDSLYKEKQRLTQEYQRQLAVIEQARWGQVTELVNRHKAQLQEEYHKELANSTKELQAQLDQGSSALQKEYQVKILSLKVKIELLEEDAKERSALSGQINDYQRELTGKLDSLEDEYQVKLKNTEAKWKTHFEQALEKYIDELTNKTQSELEDQRLALEGELKEHLVRIDQDLAGASQTSPMTPGGTLLDKDQGPSFAGLAQKISSLRNLMLEDIRQVAETCAYRQGLDTVVLTGNEAFGGQDITDDVRREYLKEEGTEDEAH